MRPKLFLVFLATVLVVVAADAGKSWKDVQGRTTFRAAFTTESKKIILEPMTPVWFVVRWEAGNRAPILDGDVFQDCYFDVLYYEVDVVAGGTVQRNTLGLRCKDHVFQVESVGVPKPPPEKARP